MPKMSGNHDKPLLFISHKETDESVATVVSEFITDVAQARIDIFQSSNPDFKGPSSGADLNESLKEALGKAEMVLLIYTSADKDWSYCMWELGVATDPASTKTKVIIFQCGKDAPPIFRSQVRVTTSNRSSIKRFVRKLMTDAKFIPKLGGPLTGYGENDAIIDTKTDQLHKVLQDIFRYDVSKEEVWPLLRIELNREDASKIEKAHPKEMLNIARDIVLSKALLTDVNNKVAALFDLNQLRTDIRLNELLEIWQEEFEDEDPIWLDALCDQIARGTKGRSPSSTSWARFKSIRGEVASFPALSRVARDLEKVAFDIYFYKLDPLAEPVRSKMIPRSKMYSRNLSKTPADTLKLKKLLSGFNKSKRNRMPFLDGDNRIQYIVHRSMIDQFMVKKALEQKNLDSLTFADVLKDEELKEMFESTFALVHRQATLAQAKEEMDSIEDCRDVFVTEEGKADEPVLGWLTNLLIVESK